MKSKSDAGLSLYWLVLAGAFIVQWWGYPVNFEAVAWFLVILPLLVLAFALAVVATVFVAALFIAMIKWRGSI